MRTALLAEKLLERGHSILWWASAFEHQQKKMISDRDTNFRVSERYNIRVLRGCGYKKNLSLMRYIDHQIVAIKFKLQSSRFPKPDLIVASMPDHSIAHEAAWYARKNNVQFIVDIRDLWPDIFLNRFKKIGLYKIGKIAMILDFLRLNNLLKEAASLTAVSKGYLDWGLSKIRRTENSRDKVFYIGYKKNGSEEGKSELNFKVPALIQARKGQKIFLFMGTFGISYELELILRVAEKYQKSNRQDIYFMLVGIGEKYNVIRNMITRLNNVVIPGWINKNEIKKLLGAAYVGLVPCHSVIHTIPNKIFEYLSAGLPIISSLEGEMADLIERYQFGLNYSPGDLEGLYNCIEKLRLDVDLHKQMSKNAMDFYRNYGDADIIYANYARYIEELADYKKEPSIKKKD
jgi:glycosyltransferase involved in cell wall biosynthesis